MKAIVDGLEIHDGVGLVIQCDICKTIFDNDTRGMDKWRVQDAARKAGWTGHMERDSTDDMCPKCKQLTTTKATE